MDLRQIGLDILEWIHVAQDNVKWWTVVNTVKNHWVP
jgi:hypothetical protein